MPVHTGVHHSSGQVLPFRESLLAMLGIAFVTMLVALDQTIVGTALPTIVADLHGFNLYAWIASAYLLASVVTVPIFGRLGDYYGRKPFVLASVLVFTGASVLCGMSRDMQFLVWMRGLQGIGGGMLVGTAFASVPDLFPDSGVRLRWQVILSSAFGVANALGPSLGGLLTQYLGWRSVFYVNLPVGALSLWFVWRYLPHIRHGEGGRIRLDWPGALLIATALGALQLFVEGLPHHGLSGWQTPLLIFGVAAGVGLWHWEKRCEQPVLPLDMFANRGLSVLFLLAMLSGFSMFSLIFYGPLLFQGGFGMSPREAGLVITPLVVFITIGSIVNGRVVTRIPRPSAMLPIGLALFAVACVGIVITGRSTSDGMLMTLMMFAGIGLGFVLPNLTVFAQQIAGRQQLGIATALLQSLRMIGGMIGTAITGTLVNQLYAGGVRHVLEVQQALAWRTNLADPQVLIDHDDQTNLIATLTHAGHDGAGLIDAARNALIHAIHMGILLGAVVAIYAVWCSRRVPAIELRRRAYPVNQTK